MSMRIQELHPAIVHFPIALFPTTIGADLVGRLTNNESLRDAGKWGMMLTAGSTVLAAATGAIAQETAEVEGEAHDYLVTHRNLNLGFLGLAAYMAARRADKSTASPRYLVAGALGSLLLTYSAYLGGHMVYEYGLGVKEGGSLKEDEAPEMGLRNIGRVTYVSTKNLWQGVRNTVQHLASGDLVPVWTDSHTTRREEENER